MQTKPQAQAKSVSEQDDYFSKVVEEVQELKNKGNNANEIFNSTGILVLHGQIKGKLNHERVIIKLFGEERLETLQTQLKNLENMVPEIVAKREEIYLRINKERKEAKRERGW